MIFPDLPFKVRDYTVTRKISHGAFSSVFEAVSEKYKRTFALKISLNVGPENKIIFANEVIALCHLNHPNIVKMFDYFIEDGKYFIVLEHCTRSLQSVLDEEQNMLKCMNMARKSSNQGNSDDIKICNFPSYNHISNKFGILNSNSNLGNKKTVNNDDAYISNSNLTKNSECSTKIDPNNQSFDDIGDDKINLKESNINGSGLLKYNKLCKKKSFHCSNISSNTSLKNCTSGGNFNDDNAFEAGIMQFFQRNKHIVSTNGDVFCFTPKVYEYFKQITVALAFVHQKGFCHRDLKPENIMVDEETNKIKIIDFGISMKVFSLKNINNDFINNSEINNYIFGNELNNNNCKNNNNNTNSNNTEFNDRNINSLNKNDFENINRNNIKNENRSIISPINSNSCIDGINNNKIISHISSANSQLLANNISNNNVSSKIITNNNSSNYLNMNKDNYNGEINNNKKSNNDNNAINSNSNNNNINCINGEYKVNIFNGTYVYCAPEVLSLKPHDPFKAESWSLGVLLYKMMTNRLPWDCRTIAGADDKANKGRIIDAIKQGLYETNDTIPPEMRKVLRYLLQVQPQTRLTVVELKDKMGINEERGDNNNNFNNNKNLVPLKKFNSVTIGLHKNSTVTRKSLPEEETSKAVIKSGVTFTGMRRNSLAIAAHTMMNNAAQQVTNGRRCSYFTAHKNV